MPAERSATGARRRQRRLVDHGRDRGDRCRRGGSEDPRSHRGRDGGGAGPRGDASGRSARHPWQHGESDRAGLRGSRGSHRCRTGRGRVWLQREHPGRAQRPLRRYRARSESEPGGRGARRAFRVAGPFLQALSRRHHPPPADRRVPGDSPTAGLRRRVAGAGRRKRRSACGQACRTSAPGEQLRSESQRLSLGGGQSLPGQGGHVRDVRRLRSATGRSSASGKDGGASTVCLRNGQPPQVSRRTVPCP